MNWVAPIKDEKTLNAFREKLRETDEKYYIMFEIGVGTGMQLQEILKLKNKDIAGKKELTVKIGTKSIKTTFKISPELQKIIANYTKDKDPNAYLIIGYKNSDTPLSREQAYRVFRSVGRQVGLNSIGAQTMRKTFAWKYYQETGDIYYLQKLFNHASPSITYRYIGEKSNVTTVFKKLTAEENERSRRVLYQDNSGKKRIGALVDMLNGISMELDNPANPDAFYGRVDSLLTELETIVKDYNTEK